MEIVERMRMESKHTGPRISRVVFVYAAVSIAWIAISDHLVGYLLADRQAATGVSIAKGLFFVALTSWLLYLLLLRFQRRLHRAYEERLRSLILLQAVSDNSTDAIYAKGLDGTYILANRAAADIVGVTPSRMVGRADTDLYPSEEAAALSRNDKDVVARGAAITVTELLPTPSGPRLFDTTKGPLFDATGQLLGVFGIARDATDRVAATEGMRNAAVELAATLQAIPDLLFDLDSDGIYHEVWTRNPELLVSQREHVIGRSVRDVLPNAAAEIVMAAVAAADSQGSSSGQTIELQLDGKPHWFELSTTKKGQDRNGRTHVLMLSRNVTRRKLAEAELSRHQEYLRLMLAHAPAALAMFDLAMRYLTVSDRWLADYGLNRDEIIGRSHYEIFPDLPDAWKAAHRMAMAGESLSADEDKMVLRDGSVTWLKWELHPWKTADGEVGGIVIMTEDITARKAVDAKIAEYVTQVERMAHGALRIVAKALDKRDPYTSGHQRRVGMIAADIGRKMGWSAHQCKDLELIGLVHDVGKIGIPSEILTKPTRLSETEFELMKSHPDMGFEILSGVDFPTPVAEIVRQHHEHLDGSGYPQGLKGTDIRPEARIIAVADVLESMASHRPYRPALGVDAALEELERHNTWYDADVVRTVANMIRHEGYTLPSLSRADVAEGLLR